MSNKFARVLSFGLCLVIIVSFLAGCAASPAAPTASTSATQPPAVAETKAYKIGFSNFSLGNSWRVQMQEEFRIAAEDLKAKGVISEYYITNSNNDIPKQIADVKDLITKQVDAIIITAASPTALGPVCEEAMDKGIKVISFDNYLETEKQTSRVGVDQVEFGKLGAEFLVKALEGKGDIVMLNGMAGTLGGDQRTQGAEEVFKNYPDIKVLGSAYADWDYAKGKAATENFLAAYPKIDGVWSQGGAMTQGAIDAFAAANRPMVPMTGEANNGMLKAWSQYADKGLRSIGPSAPTYVSVLALELALDALSGKQVEKSVTVPFEVVTDETLASFYKPDLPDSFWNITRLTDEQVKALFSK